VAAGGIWLSPNLDPTTTSLPPPPPPSSPHHPTASALTQYHILRYIHFIYHHYLPPQLSGTLWMVLMLTASFLPTLGHAAAIVSTYSPSIYLLLMFCYVLHAPLPPHHGFFNPSTWWLIHVEALFLHDAAKVSTQVSIHDGCWRCLLISIPFLPPSPAPQPSSTFLPPASHLSSPTPICSIVWCYEVSWYVIIFVCPVV
jgi:hypothetical protein